MVEIVQKENPVLRRDTRDVKPEEIKTEKIQKILSDLKLALVSQDDGVAIAAPQIGVSLRIFVVSGKVFPDDEGKQGKEKVFINPVIKKLSKKKEDLDEGCLSVRWKYGIVRRSTNASIKALDEDGSPILYNATGLLAQVFQHETDHLKGILFTDKAKDLRDVKPEDLQKTRKLS